MGRCVVAVVLLAGSLLGARPALAEPAPRVRAPTPPLVAAAKAALPRGLVILVESDGAGELTQATFFGRVQAPQKVVFDLLADPASLPRTQPAMNDVEVRTKRGRALTYTWRYGDAIATIPGTTAMAIASPAAVQLRMLDGFGPGEMLYRLYPEGPSRTLVTLSQSIDISRASHPLLRWLSQNSPDFHQAWNLGYGAMAVRGVEDVAAADAGGSSPRPTSGEAGSGALQPLDAATTSALAPLLARGRVAIVETDGQGRIAQATVVERVAAPPATVMAVLRRPAEWGRFMRAIHVRGDRATAAGRAFSLSFSFPAFSVGSDLALSPHDDGIDLTSPTGSLRGSLLTFRVAPDGEGSVMTSAARVRLRQGGLVLRRMIDDDPTFGHALNAALLMTMSRSFAQAAEGRR